MGEPNFEIRKDSAGELDEIVADTCSLHIERMSTDGWFIGITEPDGTYHQFWLGAANYRSRVEVRHTETSPPRPSVGLQLIPSVGSDTPLKDGGRE